MNLERLRWGEWIAAIAALDLVLVTFRAWYKLSGGGARVTAWDALEQGRYLLIATAVVGIFLWVLRAAEDTQPLSFPPGWIAAAVGFACTVYTAYRLATPPSDSLDPDIGLYLGLASALGVTIGGLLSGREPGSAVAPSRTASEVAADTFTGPRGEEEPLGALVPDSGGTWSPAQPAATSGWSPAAAAPSVPPATAAGAAAGGERALQSGDSVVLTAGGSRFPAGTVAEVVEVFSGGALVEVKAPDGMVERFEVPESAYERVPAGGAAAAATPAGEAWSPAMPAPASEDWGFDEPGAGRGAATADTGEGAAEAKPAKVPWWKRDIGGGKKKDKEAEELGAAGAVAAGAAVADAETNGAGEEQKPGFFKRLFGGGEKAEPETEALEDETTPASGIAGAGPAAESDTAAEEPVAESAIDEAPAEPEAIPEPAPERIPEPEPERIPEPEPEPIPEPTPEPEASEPEVVAAEPEPEPAASAPEPSAPEAAAPAIEPEPPAVEPEPAPPEPEPEPEPPAPEPEAPAPASAAPVVEPEPSTPEPETPAPEPEPPAPEPEPEPPAPEPVASAPGEEAPQPKPKRKRSSGSRKVPKEAVAATAGDNQPKVGDEVQLKVGGGKFDAGTKGTVVDVFSAGVIVELSDDEGRTERLDLPFEAIGPAEK